MKMRVILKEGEPVVTDDIGPRAQVAVERKYDGLYSEFYDEESGKARVEIFYYTAFVQLGIEEHASVDGVEFDDWLATITDVEPVVVSGRKKTGARPTQRAAKRASSSS